MALALDATPLGRAARLGRATGLGTIECGTDDQGELARSVVAVLCLTSTLTRDQVAFARELVGEPLEQPDPIGIGDRRRRGRVPAQLDLARDLVDVLAARAAGPRERDAELAGRDRQAWRDHDVPGRGHLPSPLSPGVPAVRRGS